MISPSQRPLPDNTQQSQQTNIHAPGGIRTHNLSRRAAKDLRLRPRGQWDRHFNCLVTQNSIYLAINPPERKGEEDSYLLGCDVFQFARRIISPVSAVRQSNLNLLPIKTVSWVCSKEQGLWVVNFSSHFQSY